MAEPLQQIPFPFCLCSNAEKHRERFALAVNFCSSASCNKYFCKSCGEAAEHECGAVSCSRCRLKAALVSCATCGSCYCADCDGEHHDPLRHAGASSHSCTLLSTAHDSPGPSKWLLIVAVGSLEQYGELMEGPRNDAALMYDELRSHWGFSDVRKHLVLYDQGATQVKIRQALSRLLRCVQGGDDVICAFSGVGRHIHLARSNAAASDFCLRPSKLPSLGTIDSFMCYDSALEPGVATRPEARTILESLRIIPEKELHWWYQRIAEKAAAGSFSRRGTLTVIADYTQQTGEGRFGRLRAVKDLTVRVGSQEEIPPLLEKFTLPDQTQMKCSSKYAWFGGSGCPAGAVELVSPTAEMIAHGALSWALVHGLQEARRRAATDILELADQARKFLSTAGLHRTALGLRARTPAERPMLYSESRQSGGTVAPFVLGPSESDHLLFDGYRNGVESGSVWRVSSQDPARQAKVLLFRIRIDQVKLNTCVASILGAPNSKLLNSIRSSRAQLKAANEVHVLPEMTSLVHFEPCSSMDPPLRAQQIRDVQTVLTEELGSFVRLAASAKDADLVVQTLRDHWLVWNATEEKLILPPIPHEELEVLADDIEKHSRFVHLRALKNSARRLLPNEPAWSLGGNIQIKLRDCPRDCIKVANPFSQSRTRMVPGEIGLYDVVDPLEELILELHNTSSENVFLTVMEFHACGSITPLTTRSMLPAMASQKVTFHTWVPESWLMKLRLRTLRWDKLEIFLPTGLVLPTGIVLPIMAKDGDLRAENVVNTVRLDEQVSGQVQRGTLMQPDRPPEGSFAVICWGGGPHAIKVVASATPIDFPGIFCQDAFRSLSKKHKALRPGESQIASPRAEVPTVPK